MKVSITHLWLRFVLFCAILVGLQGRALAQTDLGEITTSSTSCLLTLSVCNGDTLLLNPTNTTGFTNFKWYYDEVLAANEVTGPLAAEGVVSVDNDAIVVTGLATYGTAVTRTYILTGEYATPMGCAAINDGYSLNLVFFSPISSSQSVRKNEATGMGFRDGLNLVTRPIANPTPNHSLG